MNKRIAGLNSVKLRESREEFHSNLNLGSITEPDYKQEIKSEILSV